MSKKIVKKFFNFFDYTANMKKLYKNNKNNEDEEKIVDLSFLHKNGTYIELNELCHYFKFIPIQSEDNVENEKAQNILAEYLNKDFSDFLNYTIVMGKNYKFK